jgi:NAD(P)-dependent dehydrogenase (short-subunit alcohol dehydrogenase family)
MSNQRVVLITGASSGVGQATARLLAQQGHKVFGTSRAPTSAEQVANLTMVALDVRSDASVAACVNAVSSQAGRVDVLVNNAGYELGGALEEHSIDEAKAQFETNFFGVVRMTKAVLPLMRRQKQGQIVNISSLSGFAPIPFMGMYSASKCAVEGYTEALRMELKPLNIHVSQIEPGFLKSPMMDKRLAVAERIGDYEPWRQRAFKAVRDAEEKGLRPERVAEAVSKILASPAPRLRYMVGGQAHVISRLKRFFPERAFEMGARSTFKLDRDA